MAIIALRFSQAAMHTLSHMRFSQVKLEIHEWQAAIQLHKLVELTFPNPQPGGPVYTVWM